MSAQAVELWLVIAGLYFLELLARPAPPRRLLTGAWPFGFAVRGPGLTLRTLWPWGLTFVLDGFTLWPGAAALVVAQPHRVTTRTPAGWGQRVLRWERAAPVSVDGGSVRVGAVDVLDTGSPRAARATARWLDELRQAPDRPGAARAWMAARLDADSVPIQRVRSETRTLRLLATLLWLGLLAAVPVLFATRAGARAPLLVLAALMALVAGVVTEYARVHRRWHPDDRGERWARVAVMALAWPIACRATDTLVYDALQQVHALAAMRALARPRSFAAELGRALRELPHPRSADPAVASVETELAALALPAVRALGVAAGLDPDALVAPPQRRSPAAVTYCPRCREEFTAGPTMCADCAVALRGFAADHSRSTAS